MAERKLDSAGDERTANNGVRHQYRQLDDAEKAAMVRIKDAGQALLDAIEETGAEIGRNGREMALAKTNAEQAVMWAVKGLTA